MGVSVHGVLECCPDVLVRSFAVRFDVAGFGPEVEVVVGSSRGDVEVEVWNGLVGGGPAVIAEGDTVDVVSVEGNRVFRRRPSRPPREVSTVA